jgi:hypothetical protein
MRSKAPIISAVLGLFLAVPMTSRSVSACSCPQDTLISPADEAVDVPINAVVIFESPGAPTVFDETHNVLVNVSAEPFSRRTWLLRPNEPWAANSTFRVGTSSFPGYIPSRFTTGASRDDTAPIYAGLTSFRSEVTALPASLPCRNSCWNDNSLRRLHLEYAAPPPDVSLLLLEFDVGGGDAGAVGVPPIPLFGRYSKDWPTSVDNAGCGFGTPEFAPGQEICAQIVAIDVAGHRSEASPKICQTVRACAAKFEPSTCILSETCDPPTDPDAGLDATSDAGTNGDAPPVDSPEGGTGGTTGGSGGTSAGSGGATGGDDADGGCSIARTRETPGSSWSRIVPLLAAGVWLRRRKARAQ